MRNIFIANLFATFLLSCKTNKPDQNDEKIVALTFDDAVKSHLNFVIPLLKEMGFVATFFISYRWMRDTSNFMIWNQIGQLHKMGFEIGNHTWSHVDYSLPGKADVPCLHADPKFPNCAPGDTMRLEEKLWFYKGNNIEEQMW